MMARYLLSILLIAGWCCSALAQGVAPINTTALVTSTTTLSATGSAILSVPGYGTTGISATGSGAGLTFSAQGWDGAQWVTLPAVPLSGGSYGSVVTSMTTNGNWLVNSAPYQKIQINLTAISGGAETFILTATGSTSLPASNNSATNPLYTAPTAQGSAASLTNPFPAAAPPIGDLVPVAAGSGFKVYKSSAGAVAQVEFAQTGNLTGFISIWDGPSPPGDGGVGPKSTLGGNGVLACAPILASTAAPVIFKFDPPRAFDNGLSVYFADGSGASCLNKVTSDSTTTLLITVQGQ
jgi:hypothetical protein